MYKIPVVHTYITTSEVPGKVALAFELGGCKQHCKGCHSPQLAEEVPYPWSVFSLNLFISQALELYPEVEVLLFMGGTNNQQLTKEDLKALFESLHNLWHLPTALYSGRDDDDLDFYLNIKGLAYFKTGSYKEVYGGLEEPNTNQRFFEKQAFYKHTNDGVYLTTYYEWEDKTHLFRRKDLDA